MGFRCQQRLGLTLCPITELGVHGFNLNAADGDHIAHQYGMWVNVRAADDKDLIYSPCVSVCSVCGWCQNDNFDMLKEKAQLCQLAGECLVVLQPVGEC